MAGVIGCSSGVHLMCQDGICLSRDAILCVLWQACARAVVTVLARVDVLFNVVREH